MYHTEANIQNLIYAYLHALLAVVRTGAWHYYGAGQLSKLLLVYKFIMNEVP